MSAGGPGRPSKLTPEVQEKICRALRGGNFRSTAAWYAGISPRTLQAWMAEGETNPDSPEGNFCAAVIESEKGAEIDAVETIIAAGKSDPKHFQWWLSHRHSARWAEKKNVKMSGSVDLRPLEGVSPEKLAKLLDGPDDSDS